MADFGHDPRSSNSLRLFDRDRFSKKTQKLLTKFPGFVTLGCHNSAMITNAENSRQNSTLRVV